MIEVDVGVFFAEVETEGIDLRRFVERRARRLQTVLVVAADAEYAVRVETPIDDPGNDVVASATSAERCRQTGGTLSRRGKRPLREEQMFRCVRC